MFWYFFFLLKYVAIACYQLAQPNLIFLLPAGPKRKINFETPRKKTWKLVEKLIKFSRKTHKTLKIKNIKKNTNL
jgi:hypothetical protein